jgi:hypothetical protein
MPARFSLIFSPGFRRDLEDLPARVHDEVLEAVKVLGVSPKGPHSKIKKRVVDGADGLFDRGERMLREIDDLEGVAPLEELLDGVDHVVDAVRVVVRRAVVDELPGIDSAVDGRAIRCEVEALRGLP